MTFGWTLLAASVVIAVLYVTRTPTERLIPPECTFQPGFSCDAFKLAHDNLTIVFANGFGHTINITSVTGDCTKTGGLPITVANGDSLKIENILCSNVGEVGKQFSGKLRLNYSYYYGGMVKNHTIQGLITANIEQ